MKKQTLKLIPLFPVDRHKHSTTDNQSRWPRRQVCFLQLVASLNLALFFPEGEWWLIIYIKPLFEVLSSKVLEDINQGEQAASHICSE